MLIEKQCVVRSSVGLCDKNCEQCAFAEKDTDLIEAHQMVDFAIQKMMKHEYDDDY